MVRHTSLFRQVWSLIDRHEFSRCVSALKAEKGVRFFGASHDILQLREACLFSLPQRLLVSHLTADSLGLRTDRPRSPCRQPTRQSPASSDRCTTVLSAAPSHSRNHRTGERSRTRTCLSRSQPPAQSREDSPRGWHRAVGDDQAAGARNV